MKHVKGCTYSPDHTGPCCICGPGSAVCKRECPNSQQNRAAYDRQKILENMEFMTVSELKDALKKQITKVSGLLPVVWTEDLNAVAATAVNNAYYLGVNAGHSEGWLAGHAEGIKDALAD